MMKRALVLASATVLGFALAGGLTGGALGFLVPGFYRSVFRSAGYDAFNPVEVGLGSGVIARFLVGAIAVAAWMVAQALPGLARRRRLAGRPGQSSFAGLLLAVAATALGLASLKSPSRAAVQLWFSFTALALAWATLVAVGRPIGRRGFAAGFAVLGWAYLILSLSPESRAQLPTSDLLAAWETRLSGGWTAGFHLLTLETGPFPARQRGTIWEPVVTSLGGIPGRLQIDEIQPEFRRIGHSLFALLVGVVGGVLGELRETRRRHEPGMPGGPQ